MAYSASEAVRLGMLVLTAYDLDTQGDPPDFRPPNPYTLVSKVYADDITDHDPDYKVFGFIARSGGDVVVAIRGTEGIVEWLWDFEFALERFPFGGACRTESGFTHFYSTLRTGPDDTKPRVFDSLKALVTAGGVQTLTIAGHSLGSAVATMLALEIAAAGVFKSPRVYTFASPRVGDAAFAHQYNSLIGESWRIVNLHDRVPDLPPELLGFAHADKQTTIDSANGTRHSISCYHQLRTYLNTLDDTIALDAGCVSRGQDSGIVGRV